MFSLAPVHVLDIGAEIQQLVFNRHLYDLSNELALTGTLGEPQYSDAAANLIQSRWVQSLPCRRTRSRGMAPKRLHSYRLKLTDIKFWGALHHARHHNLDSILEDMCEIYVFR